MKKNRIVNSVLSFVFALSLTPSVSAQAQTVCLGDDITVCTGTDVEISNCSGTIGGSGISLQNPTNVSLTDDRFSAAVNIGFPFSFYGVSYNQCVIGSNGMISFDMSHVNGYNSWSLNGTPLPNASVGDSRNAAMLAYQDINPNTGGSIMYETIGTAPNRMFVVLYMNIPMYQSGECSYQAAIFHETSNEIEFHIGHKPISTWNGGRAIQGLQNAAGTVAHIVPGRNNSQWTATDDARLFTPDSPTNTTNYTITQIPYKSVVDPAANFTWKSTLGQLFPYNNGVLEINNVSAGTTGYFLTVTSTGCQSQMGGVSDTTFITGLVTTGTATATPDFCTSGAGSVTATPTSGDDPFTFNWPALGETNATVDNVTAGTYTVHITDANGCTGTTTVVVPDNPVDYTATSTLVSCPGGDDGTATAVMTPAIGNISYQWNDPDNQTTQTAVGLRAGVYECTITSDVGCSGVAQVTVEEIPGMTLQVLAQTDATCNSGSDGTAIIEVTQGTGPYNYSWTGSNSTSAVADDLDAGSHIVTVTDDNGCVITEEIIIGEPAALTITDISQDSIVCIGDSARLYAEGAGGSSAYLYTWSKNGEVVGEGSEIYVLPTAQSTEYCVTLSETCGSPITNACTKVDHPAEVTVLLDPDKTGECFPIEVTFDNLTDTQETIDYTIWKYSDGDRDTVPGSMSVTHEFGEGIFDVEMLVVTTRGCEYVKKFNKLIEGYSYPVPNFYATPNPASMYEPTVSVFSQSSNDIISYQWDAPGATPSYSSLQNPTFNYPNEIKNYPVTLTVENEFGCIDSIQKLIRIENEVLLFSPNSFTPDGDAHNENWRVHIQGVDIYNFHLQLFNRWGELVYESFDVEGEWDGTYGGKYVPAGTYIWTISAEDYDNDNKYEFNGIVNVLR